MRRLLWPCLTWCLATGCPATRAPGDVDLGTYEMHADPVSFEGCELPDAGEGVDAGFLLAPAGFDFEATFSLEADSGRAFMTIGATARDAGWDGQVLDSTASAQRQFTTCAACTTVVTETLVVALLSRSQAEPGALACPANPLDGGTPPPDDAGVTGPGLTDAGFDSVLACGELHATVVADGGACPDVCHTCATSFSLQGRRK